MWLFEQAIKVLCNKGIKKALQLYTQSPFMSAFIWMLLTALTQSSSVIGVIIIWFVGAWILWLSNAIGIMIWANIWSTFTPWLVVLLGFNFDISTLSLYLVGLGWLWLIVTDWWSKYNEISKSILWFGLLFLWLHFMKESIDTVATTWIIDFAEYAHFNILVFVIIGVIVTVLLQTSAALAVLALAALDGWVISFTMTIWLMIWANIGTAASTWLAAFLSGTGRSVAKKQVAVAHIMFNTITAAIVLVFLPYVLRFVELLAWTSSLVYNIVIFHTVFNLSGTILILPFLKQYSWFINRIIPKPQYFLGLRTPDIATQLPEEIINAVEHDTHVVWSSVLSYFACVFGFDGTLASDKWSSAAISSLQWKMSWASFGALPWSSTGTTSQNSSGSAWKTPFILWWSLFTKWISRIKDVLHLQHAMTLKTVFHKPNLHSCNASHYIHLKKIESKLTNFFVSSNSPELTKHHWNYLHQTEAITVALFDCAKKIKENVHHIVYVTEIQNNDVRTYREAVAQHVEMTCQRILHAYPTAADADLPPLNGEIDALMMHAIQSWHSLDEEDVSEILKTHRHIHASVSKLIETYHLYTDIYHMYRKSFPS
jgi:Na/Pi-cotransporter